MNLAQMMVIDRRDGWTSPKGAGMVLSPFSGGWGVEFPSGSLLQEQLASPHSGETGEGFAG
jgi:hypothetical protein